VRDQGVGIPPADLTRVFQPYTRGTNVVGVLPGSGIGLSGARHIVAQHGGTLSVESVEGKGSTFTVWLPIGPSDSLPVAPTAAATPDASHPAGHRPPAAQERVD
jgi:signal transduction histidine kinase